MQQKRRGMCCKMTLMLMAEMPSRQHQITRGWILRCACVSTLERACVVACTFERGAVRKGANPPKYQISGLSVPRFHDAPSPPRILQNMPRECSCSVVVLRTTTLTRDMSRVTCTRFGVSRVTRVLEDSAFAAVCKRSFVPLLVCAHHRMIGCIWLFNVLHSDP